VSAFYAKGLAAEFLKDCKEFDLPSADQAIVYKIIGPDMVDMLRRTWNAAPVSMSFPGFSSGKAKTLLFPKPVHRFVVDLKALAAKEHMSSPVAIALLFLRNVPKSG